MPGKNRGKNKNLLEKTKKEITEVIKEAGDLLTSLLHTFSGAVFNTVKSGVLIEISVKSKTSDHKLRSTIFTVVEVGGGLEVVAKFIMARVISESRKSNCDIFDVISKTSGSIIRSTAEAAGDVDCAARGAVLGALQGANEIGMDIQEAASAAASGAVEEAYQVSFGTGSKVLEALMSMISEAEEREDFLT